MLQLHLNTQLFDIEQVNKSFATFCSVFRVHALACSRQRSAAGNQTEVWTLNFSKNLETFAYLLRKSHSKLVQSLIALCQNRSTRAKIV